MYRRTLYPKEITVLITLITLDTVTYNSMLQHRPGNERRGSDSLRVQRPTFLFMFPCIHIFFFFFLTSKLLSESARSSWNKNWSTDDLTLSEGSAASIDNVRLFWNQIKYISFHDTCQTILSGVPVSVFFCVLSLLI